MANSKEKNKTGIEQNAGEKNISSLNKNKDDNNEEIYSDGSGNAFEETERVEEDNFDDLKEK